MMSNASPIRRSKQPHEGRASRAEFWKVLVLTGIVGIGGEVGNQIMFGLGRTHDFLLFVLALITFLPIISVSIRRLHDLNCPGWYLFVVLVPILGLLLVIFWGCMPGTSGANRYGDDPRNGTAGNFVKISASTSATEATDDRGDALTKMERLVELRANGALSESEFSAMKAQILGKSRLN
jgi:uncharacterized membrane protein YhaH (DUF805 family)